MKKLNTYTIFLTAFTLWVLPSCDKQLSEPPANARVDQNAIIDQKSAEVALNGVYAYFANVTSDNITSWTSNNISGAMLSGSIAYGFGAVQDELNNNVQASYPTQQWPYCYKIVNAANGVIQSVEQISDQAFEAERKEQIIAEAKFLRAYANFRLLMFFGVWNDIQSPHGILIREELSTLTNMQKARSSVAESYDFILEDLNYAAAHAPTTNPSYQATKWTAMLLKMRTLAMRGQAEDWEAIPVLADQIIHESGYELESSLQTLFRSQGLASKEVLLGVKPQANQEAFYYILSRAYYPAQSTFFVATKTLKDLLADDPRLDWVIGPPSPYQDYSPDTYYFTKFIEYGENTSQLTETNYAFRLTEVYLLKAEALVRSGGDIQTAKSLLKTIMEHAGITDFSTLESSSDRSALLEMIFVETFKNFAGEDSIEWFALARMPFDFVKTFKPTIVRPEQLYFPVPRSEFDRNQAFGDQNPGYGI